MNCEPSRLVFVRTHKEKERLMPCLAEGNRAKTMAAPVTVIVGYDTAFYENLSTLFPYIESPESRFVNNPMLSESTAFRNSSLQGGYLIMAARALGLDCGPMSGFDNQAVDHAFFANSSIRSNFI
jgi:3-hydroxypropanoate dehydrogenase